MIDAPKSLLPLLVFDAKDNWDVLGRDGLCAYLGIEGQDRLKEMLDGHVKAVVVEKQYLDKDYRDTFSAYHSKRFSTPPSRCERLHFFAEPITRADLDDEKMLQRHYMGYAVIRPTLPNSIGRTLIDPNRLTSVAGWLRTCEERVSLQGISLKAYGFPFISQDTDVTVCAQSALWMLLRFYSNKYHLYKEIYPSEIGMLVKDYSIGRIFPSQGLNDWQMAECLRQLGFSPLIYNRQNDPKKLFDFLLYTYIESGIPLLVSVPDHVVVGFGHTSDFARALPAGNDPVLTSHFNSGYVTSDDNYMPYQLIGDTQPAMRASTYKIKDIEAFIVPLPVRVHLPADDAYGLCLKILNHPKLGYAVRSPSLKSERLVLRMFLTTCRSFKGQLRARGMGHPLVEQLYKGLPMPHFIWVCELSTPGAFGKHHVLGELIWDATRNAYEPNGWIALHYPEMLMLDVGSTMNRRFNPQEIVLPGGTSYGVYCHNLSRVH